MTENTEPKEPFNKALDFADIMRKKTAVSKKVKIQLDGAIAIKMEALEDELDEARAYDKAHNEPDRVPEVEKKIEALVQSAKETSVTFEFQGIGRAAYDKLVEAHPPRKEDKDNKAEFNVDTFPPALIAASSFEPKITEEQAELIFNDPSWSQAELLKLFYTAYSVNNEVADLPKSRSGSGMTTDSLLTSLMQLSTGSPTPST